MQTQWKTLYANSKANANPRQACVSGVIRRILCRCNRRFGRARRWVSAHCKPLPESPSVRLDSSIEPNLLADLSSRGLVRAGEIAGNKKPAPGPVLRVFLVLLAAKYGAPGETRTPTSF